MTREDILERLRQTMRRSSPGKGNWDAVTAETAIESLGFDSLTMLDLIYDIQQEFGLEFEAEQLVRVRSVGELADFLQARGV